MSMNLTLQYYIVIGVELLLFDHFFSFSLCQFLRNFFCFHYSFTRLFTSSLLAIILHVSLDRIWLQDSNHDNRKLLVIGNSEKWILKRSKRSRQWNECQSEMLYNARSIHWRPIIMNQFILFFLFSFFLAELFIDCGWKEKKSIHFLINFRHRYGELSSYLVAMFRLQCHA